VSSLGLLLAAAPLDEVFVLPDVPAVLPLAPKDLVSLVPPVGLAELESAGLGVPLEPELLTVELVLDPLVPEPPLP
jgi:hypothetical protein